jgi:transposase-like protein
LAYEHVAELLAERGLEVDASCVWRWVQVYSPELNKRCQPHLKRTNKSYRVDETYIRLRVKTSICTGLGYGSFQSAWRTLEGIETMSMIRKGRVRRVTKGNVVAEAKFILGLFAITA